MPVKKTDGRKFWKTTPLDEMSREQWESLCDKCGRCCMHKILFEDTALLVYTRVACRHLDARTCRCSAYEERSSVSPDCLVLTPENLSSCMYLLPDTCAYRLIARGRDLPPWHPLVSGDPGAVHRAGVSVRGKVLSEDDIEEEELEEHIIDWIRY
ncbi:MAG: YcgN family cysteine cluster protein [Desulfomonilia bacterium]|nr:YcgN family cysteine cluster protein [Desulfomonilia bacterium]HPW68396.1 YcgN family cysteine cluster protein [Deltaproteobacteria bacterium]